MTITRDEAEAKMFLAQAEKFSEEARTAREDQKIKAAEARLRTAEAVKAEYYAESARISLDTSLRSERINSANDHEHHELNFAFEVGAESVDAASAQMRVWHRLNPTCPFTIKIDSPGGSVFDGFNLFDEISAYSLREWDTRNIPKGTHKTTTIGRGMCASMAGILLQAADHRVVGPECWLLIHEIQTLCGGKIGEIREDVKFWERVSERVTDIFVRRSGGRITKTKFKQRWGGKEWWISSSEALELGFVDEIA